MARRLKRPAADHQASADEMRDHPNQWQHVHTYPARYAAVSVAGGIRRGGLGQAYQPAGAFEARTEMVDDGTAVYARYVGEDGIWAEAIRSLHHPQQEPTDEAA
jgi:hypothetical protein